jgi:hypothetical protein
MIPDRRNRVSRPVVFVYSDFTMRRAVGVFLILLFGLGPLAEALPANAESRLPPCCRRHGAHHCVMAARIAQAQSLPHSAPAFAPPATCPSYPGALAASTATVDALSGNATGLPTLLEQPLSAATHRLAPRQNQLLTRPNRGPPTSFIV